MQIYLYQTGGNARIFFPGPCFKQISHKPLTFFGLSLLHCDFFARTKNRKSQPMSKPCLLPIRVAVFGRRTCARPPGLMSGFEFPLYKSQIDRLMTLRTPG